VNNAWYELTGGRQLEQADVLPACPVLRPASYTFPLPEQIELVSDSYDLLILTQSCDLENDKVDEVLLAAVLDYDDLVARESGRNPAVRGKKWRQAAVRGDLPAYALLPPRTDAPTIGWSLVDFHHLFSLSKDYVESYAESLGSRLRILSPYKEHIAQSFARYVMRVGLPLPLSEFEGAEPVRETTTVRSS